MQFKVPQFLDIEDKIFGPFTFREFIYLAGGGGLCFILYKLLGFWLGAIPILAVGGFSAALTFYKPNNKPFLNMIEAGVKYAAQDKLYIWKKKAKKKEVKNTPSQPSPNLGENGERGQARLGRSRLRDLAWSLDVLDLSKNKEEK